MNNFDVVIVGAGQAGIAMGYYLKQENLSFVIIDANARIGDSWRNRYDSLVLFTPRGYSSLPGLPMTGSPEEFPTKDEMANYLEMYVNHFNLPIKHNTSVMEMSKNQSIFELVTDQGIIKSKQVVIASGAFQKPFIPSIITDGDKSVLQIHSSDYVSTLQIPKGSVLVVGGGNSGTQIAFELAQEREVTMSISHPFKFLPLRLLGKSIFKWLELVGLLYADIDTKRGKWFRKQSDPIFGYELKKMIAKHKINIKPRLVQVQGDKVLFQDNSKHKYDTVIWATGFMPFYDWITIDGVISSAGKPIHRRGISPIKGLYFIGLPWQSQRGSALVCGVGRDTYYLTSFIREYHNKLIL